MKSQFYNNYLHNVSLLPYIQNYLIKNLSIFGVTYIITETYIVIEVIEQSYLIKLYKYFIDYKKNYIILHIPTKMKDLYFSTKT